VEWRKGRGRLELHGGLSPYCPYARAPASCVHEEEREGREKKRKGKKEKEKEKEKKIEKRKKFKPGDLGE
jgi:ribosomal protein L12E/L44/L45/RPP1/RPP2